MTTNFYLGHDGQKLIDDKECSLSKNFDWICCKNRIIKHKDIPNTIYCKLDFLRYWYRTEIKHLDNRFILITGASDFSPSINYYTIYQNILQNSKLIVWFAENNVIYHPKVQNLSVGLATHSIEMEYILNDVKKMYIPKDTNKIYCRWRIRNGNVLGINYLERPKAEEFSRNNILCYFDESNLDYKDYLIKVKQHKYLLCPIGNGSDSSPKLAESIILGTLPIVRKSYNNYSLYKDLPILWVNHWTDITSELLETKGNKLYEKLQEKDYSYFFCLTRWVNLIKSFS